MMAYQVLNVDRRLLVKSILSEQNYFEFNLLGNWKASAGRIKYDCLRVNRVNSE